MKRFKFRFAVVSKQRSVLLEVATGVLVAARQARARVAQGRAAVWAEWQALRADVPTVGATFNAHFELLRHRVLQSKAAEVAAIDAQLAAADAEIETARVAVTEAHRALKAMQLLEERDREKWRVESRREEQNEADERNAQRFGRKNR